METLFHNMKYESTSLFHFMKLHGIQKDGKFRQMKQVPYPNKLAQLRKKAGLVQADIGKLWNCDPPLVSRIEKGTVGITQDKLLALFQAYGWSPSMIYGTEDNHTIPVLGYVGAGEEVHPIDDLPLTNGLSEHQKLQMNCEFVEAPPGGLYRDMIALKVKGESMEPFLFDGNYVYYNEIIRSSFDVYLNKRVVCQLNDGRLFLKVLKKSSNYGKYNLLSYNPYSKAIEDIELEWCAKVVFTKVD